MLLQGKLNYLAKNIDCAIKEFKEETDYNPDDYNICHQINPINEVFNGTNGVLYKHIYYIAIHKKKIRLKLIIKISLKLMKLVI